MSFPLNPVNGQQAVVNGIKYNYTEATNSWRRDFNNVLDRLFLVGQNEAYATNTSTGDLVVYGGGQFGKSVVIKSNLTVLGTINGVISTATQAISLLGGSPGALVYQSNTNTTAYIPIASTGSILLSNGVIPVWTASAGISVYYSNTATNIAGGNQYEIPYQALAGITAFSPYLKFDTTKLYISTSTSSVDTATGALVVAGGVGIGGKVYIGEDLIVRGNLTINGNTTYVNTVNLDVTDKNITIAKNSADAAAANGAGLTVDGPVVNPTLLYASSDDSWNVNKLFVGTDGKFANTTVATSSTNGALIVSGGVGIGGELYVARTIHTPAVEILEAGVGPQYVLHLRGSNTGDQISFIVSNVVGANNIVSRNRAEDFYAPLTITGVPVTIATRSGAASVTVDALGNVNIISNSSSISTTTGALTVSGGVGIAGDLTVGGNYNGTIITARYSNTATFANNVNGGLIGQIPYQTTTSTTAFSPNLTFDGTSLKPNQILILNSLTQTLPAVTYSITLQNTGNNQSQALRFSGLTNGFVLLSSYGNFKILSDTNLNQTLLNATASQVSVPLSAAASSTSTGALTVVGGVGIGGALYTGGNITASGLPVTTFTSVPVSSASTGTVGQLAADANWTYICYATNTWRRWANSTF